MTKYDYVWLYMTMYDYVWLCMTMYDYVWLWMTIYEEIIKDMFIRHGYLFGMIQHGLK